MSLHQLVHPTVTTPASEIALPPGFGTDASKKKSDVKKPLPAELDQLKVKKAWEVATGPAKSVPMNLIMSYMTGNSLQMIPIMMTLMLFWNPLKAIFVETELLFRSLVTERNRSEMYLPKVVFVLCQLANMAVGVWKLNQMGLIPNKEADWLGWKIAGAVAEKLSV